MPKELFNGTLITSPNEPDDLDRVALGQSGVQGSKNFTWARFKEIVLGLAGAFKTLSDVNVPDFTGQDKKKLTIDEATGKIIATPSTTASGFYDRTAFTVTFDGVNLNLTGTIKFVTVDEKEIIKTNDSIALTLSNKLIYVYYDNNGVLQQEFNLNRIQQEQRMKETLSVAYITNNITTPQLTFVGDYRKGRSSNSLWVKNFFDVQVYALTGIDVFDLTKGSGSVDADARFGLTAGQLLFTDGIYTTPTRQAADTWNVGYFDANLDPLGAVANAFPMLTDVDLGIGSTGLVVYNNDGVVTAATSGKLVWYFVLETVDITPSDRTLSYMGNSVYGNIAEAEGALANERATLESRLVVRQGAKVKYGVLIETKSTFANAVKARIVDVYAVEEEAGGTPTISFPAELVNGSDASLLHHHDSKYLPTSLQLQYSTTTTEADPGSGFIRFNNADLSLATEAYVSATQYSGGNIGQLLNSFVGKIKLTALGNRAKQFNLLNVEATDNTGWYTLTFTAGSLGTTFANLDVLGVTLIGGGGGAAERESTTATLVTLDAQTTTIDFSDVEVLTVPFDDGVTTHILSVSNLSTTERKNGLIIDNTANNSGLTLTFDDQTGAIKFDGPENGFSGTFPNFNIAANSKWRFEFYPVSTTEVTVTFTKITSYN